MAKLKLTDEREKKGFLKAIFGDDIEKYARNEGFKILTIFGRDIDDKSYGVDVVIPAGSKKPTDIKYGIVIREADEKTADLLNSEAAKFYLTMLDKIVTGDYEEKHFSLEVKDGNAVLFMSGVDPEFHKKLFKQNQIVKGTIINILLMLDGKEHIYELNQMFESLAKPKPLDLEAEYRKQIAAKASVYPSGPNIIKSDKSSNYKQVIPEPDKYNIIRERPNNNINAERQPSREDMKNRIDANNSFKKKIYDPTKTDIFRQ